MKRNALKLLKLFFVSGLLSLGVESIAQAKTTNKLCVQYGELNQLGPTEVLYPNSKNFDYLPSCSEEHQKAKKTSNAIKAE